MLPKGEELKLILKRAGETAKSEAKEAGPSIYYMSNGKRIRESSTGEKYEIIFDESGN